MPARTPQIVIIDEIQKLPGLLDEVHRLRELRKELRFILTGSSARKLRAGGVNLLGGRAWTLHLHPLVFPELSGSPRKTWKDVLVWGGLPAVLSSDTPREDLLAYVGTYLSQEIQAEGLVRSIPNFSRFLETAALTHGQILNFTKIGNDAQVPPRTVQDYYRILEDTLVGHLVPAYEKTRKRKAVASAKFFFFDHGIVNALTGSWSLAPGTPEFGRALEHLVFRELRAYVDHHRLDARLYYWRSRSQFEVDFIVELDRKKLLAIEVKGSRVVGPHDLKGLRAFAEDVPAARKILVCLEAAPRTTEDGIEILPAEEFLERLWNHQLIKATFPRFCPRPEGKFEFAYDAARTLATMAIRTAGYRVRAAAGHQWSTFVALESAMDNSVCPTAAYFDHCRQKRKEVLKEQQLSV